MGVGRTLAIMVVMAVLMIVIVAIATLNGYFTF
jgi:hypothetical protein